MRARNLSSRDGPYRRSEPFHGSNALFEPPAIFSRPILELPVDPEIMGPVMGDVGLNWDCRPIAIRSACPFCRIASACCASRMMRTVIEAMPTSLRTLPAEGTWQERLRGPCAGGAELEMPPEEQSIT